MTKSYPVFIIFLLSFLLIACGENNDVTTALQVEKPQISVLSDAQIEFGMAENVVSDLLGTPQSTQTRTIDALTITHTEWADNSGTVSVQFINGKVKFSHFFAK